jgi:flavodoxin
MGTLIVYESYHRMNTEKVAKAMAEAMGARLEKVEGIDPEELKGYDLVGFGSGIFGLKHYKALVNFVEKMPPMDQDVFVFSTAGIIRDVNHRLLKEMLAGKGCRVVGEFTCSGEYQPLGFNVNLPGLLVFIGGKNKGHPDAKDLENARMFARGLLEAKVE